MSPNRKALALLLSLSAFLGGCVSQSDAAATPTENPGRSSAPAATSPPAPGPAEAESLQAIAHCKLICAEPTAAWTFDGTLLVSSVLGELVIIGPKGATAFEPPAGASQRNDVLLQVDPQGRVWYTAMEEQGEWNYRAVRVARLDAVASAWTLNQRVTFEVMGEPTGRTGSVDRQWLAFDPNGPTHLLCACPGPFAVQIRTSTDDGASWSTPRPVPTIGRIGPVGPPVVDAEGRIFVPYLTGSTLLLDAPAAGVAVAVSKDRGATWTTQLVRLTGPVSGPQCCAWPHALATGKDLLVTWASGDGQLLVASSPDAGASWTTTRWPSDVPSLQGVHPWPVSLSAGRVGLIWYGGTDWQRATIRLSVAAPSQDLAASKPLEVELGMGRSMTDHPYAASSSSGRLAAPYVDSAKSITIAWWQQ